VSAIISPCGTYRYRLERAPGFRQDAVAVIMVNPSTADATQNDATIRKLLGFGERNGWGHIIVGNLFAYRATDVHELATAADPVGPDNDEHLRAIMSEADMIVVAWGASGKLPKLLRGRWRTVVRMADEMGRQLHSIGEPAKDGHPCHPLMLPYSRQLQPWGPQ